MKTFDAIILGGGAAGLMCALQAGNRGRKVAVLERSERVGKKILISGGGRCNFTNLYTGPDHFLSSNPHFAISALARYTPADFIELVERHGIAYHEKTLGQLFCDHSAHEIVEMLLEECRRSQAQIFTDVHPEHVDRVDAGFCVRTASEEFCAPALVIATGGLSIPKMGATSMGHDLARQFGIALRECRPALVPFLFSAEDRAIYAELAGVSAEVIASIGSQQFREKMLFTHRGLSGPAILQISSYWKPGENLTIDLAPGCDVTAPLLLPQARRDLRAAKNIFSHVLPARLGERWLERHIPARWTNQGISVLEQQVHHWQVCPQGTEGYEKAEVTAGGVDTDELSSRTMESRSVPGLFFIGEAVDVTGHLGGFNFQWAWASGFCAAQAL
jgi:predicted Rossmann fold flavoprotein